MIVEKEDTRAHGPRADGIEGAFSGRRVLVVGLGVSGRALSRFLRRAGADVVATDIEPESRLEGIGELADMGVRVEAGRHDPGSFSKADLIVVSPGVPPGIPGLEEARRRGVEITGEIELAWRFMDSPVIAVAGTNGKTTVTSLLGRVLEASGMRVFVGGNIGTPAIEYIDRGGGADFAVLEVSSFHLETVRTFRPSVGILLNITADHLDRYSDFDEYARTKFRLFANQDPGDFSVLNSGDPVVSGLLEGSAIEARVVPFTVHGPPGEGLFMDGANIVYSAPDGAREVYPTARFRLGGLHNLENIMAVIAAARLSGASMDAVLETVEGFRGLSHRTEFIREVDGVTYINDSKGTNVGSLLAALRGVSGPVVLIAGGRDKGGGYSALREVVGEKVRLLVLIGEARERMMEELGGLAETVLAGSLEEAVERASKAARPGDTVLLGPACSSLDMFSDYRERGESFRRLVEAL